MTVKLKELKEQPLLSPPGEPQVEVTPEQVGAMTHYLQELKGKIDSGSAAVFFGLAVNMTRMGLDVNQALKDTEQKLRAEVSTLDHWTWGPPYPAQFHWDKYVDRVAKMKRHGFDVSQELKQVGMSETIFVQHLSGYEGDKPVCFFTEMAAALTELGFQVATQVSRNETAIREEVAPDAAGERWYSVAGHLANMKRAGLDVTKEVKQYKTQIRQLLPEIVKEAKKDNHKWCEFAEHAADMCDLELLTPNPGQKRTSPPMPPPKKFQK